ncbi:MAG: hypothetical protein FWD60_13285 [Candidatus Azobacteroides sp.]|nr:hypothetical protein [Candidatus Azobacteroides sp.]
MKIWKIIMLMAILAGVSFSCRNEELFDRKTIVGKWKPISRGINEDNMMPVDSKRAYIEYFSDGTRGYYDTITEKIQINGNYQIQSGLLILDYDQSYEQGRIDYKCEFSHNNNQLKLTFANGLSDFLFSVFIYQRIE